MRQSRQSKSFWLEGFPEPRRSSQEEALCIQQCVQGALRRQRQSVTRACSFWQGIVSQTAYLGWRVWLLQMLAVATLFWIWPQISDFSEYAPYRQQASLLLLSCAGPVLCSVTMPFLTGSERWGMWELENSAVYSLPQLAVLRLTLLGSAGILLLAALVAAVCWKTELSLSLGIVCMLIPFHLSCAVCFAILERWRGNLGVGLCIAAEGIFLLLLGGSFGERWPPLNWALEGGLGGVIAAGTGILAVYRGMRFVRRFGRTGTEGQERRTASEWN